MRDYLIFEKFDTLNYISTIYDSIRLKQPGLHSQSIAQMLISLLPDHIKRAARPNPESVTSYITNILKALEIQEAQQLGEIVIACPGEEIITLGSAVAHTRESLRPIAQPSPTTITWFACMDDKRPNLSNIDTQWWTQSSNGKYVLININKSSAVAAQTKALTYQAALEIHEGVVLEIN